MTDKDFVRLLNTLMDDPGEEVLDESYKEWKDSGYDDDWEEEE